MELYQLVFKQAYNKAQSKLTNKFKNTKIKVKTMDSRRRLWDWNGTLSLDAVERELDWIKELRKIWKTEGERATGFYKAHRDKERQKGFSINMRMPKTKGQNGKDVIL